MKRKIGVDLDDVLFSFNWAFCKYHNATYGTRIDFQDITQYDLSKVYGTSVDEITRRVNEFFFLSCHDEAEPIIGAIEGTNILKDKSDLHLITSRTDPVRAQTVRWLEKHFPGVFTSVHLTNQFGRLDKKRLKSEVCRELGIEIMIEDAMHYAKDIAGIGIPVFLLDTPWNQGQVPERVTRVKNWEELGERLKEIK